MQNMVRVVAYVEEQTLICVYPCLSFITYASLE